MHPSKLISSFLPISILFCLSFILPVNLFAQDDEGGIPFGALEMMGVSSEENNSDIDSQSDSILPQIPEPESANYQPSIADNITFSGYLVSQNVIKWGGTDFDYEAALIRQRFRLTSQYEHEYFAVQVDLDFISDMPWEVDNLELQVRKAFIDIFAGNFIFTIGQQTVGWGKAVAGIFGIDLINPVDYRQFLLNDIDQLKIPIPMIKVEGNFYPVNFEILWAPVYVPSKFADADSIWYRDFTKMLPFDEMPFEPTININDYTYPDKNLENGDVAAKFSAHFLNIDLDVFYEYLIYDIPVFVKNISPIPPITDPVIEIFPEFRRIHAGGLSMETTVWDFVVKADAIYIYNTYYNYAPNVSNLDFTNITDITQAIDILNDYNDNEGVMQKDTIRYLVGLDYNRGTKFIASIQFMQTIILDYDDTIIDDQLTNMIFAILRTQQLNDKLTFEFWFICDISNFATLSRFFTTYNIVDPLSITLGIEVFTGDYDSLLGAFWKNDIIQLKIKYDF